MGKELRPYMISMPAPRLSLEELPHADWGNARSSLRMRDDDNEPCDTKHLEKEGHEGEHLRGLSSHFSPIPSPLLRSLGDEGRPSHDDLAATRILVADKISQYRLFER